MTPGSSRVLSLAALSVLELAPAEMVSCAGDAGYACVGLRLLPATRDEPAYPVIGDTPMVREIERRLDDTGVRLLDIEILRLEPDTVVQDFRAALETGARLGARHALVAGNDPEVSRLAENFAALAQLAEPLGLALSLEPMPWTDVRNVAQGMQLIERAAQPNAGLLVDAIHFDRAGDRLGDLAALPRSRLPYMQLCDAPAARPTDRDTLLHQARAERLMPGDGGLDLAGLLRTLPAGIPISIEVPMRTLARTLDARERARRLRAKTLALLDRLAKAT